MEFPFNTVGRIQSTAYYWTAPQIHSGSAQKIKGVLKFIKITVRASLVESLHFMVCSEK